MNFKGWDIISITPFDCLNKTISDQWDEVSFDIQCEGAELNGKFSKWHFIKGGGGKILRMECPIQTGVFREDETEIVLDGMKAVFNVMLNFTDKISENRKNDENNLLNLTLDCRQPRYISEKGNSDNNDESDEGGIVQPIELIGCTSIHCYTILNMLTDYIIESQQWLKNIIFADVLLKGKNGEWISPVLCRYSVIDSVKPYLAILAVCSDIDISNFPIDVDISDLDLESGYSFYAISKDLFLKNVGIDCFTNMFQSSAEDYLLTEGILSNDQRVVMPSITVGAIDYSPYVEKGNAQMKISGSQLTVDLKNGGCNLHAGIEMSWSSFNTFSCKFEDGKLEFIKEQSSFNHNESIPWYLRFIPLSFIIDICVACISDSLASGIKVSFDISDIALREIQWHDAGQEIISAFFKDGIVICF